MALIISQSLAKIPAQYVRDAGRAATKNRRCDGGGRRYLIVVTQGLDFWLLNSAIFRIFWDKKGESAHSTW